MVSKKVKNSVVAKVRQHEGKSDINNDEQNFPLFSFEYFDDISVRKNKDAKLLGQLLNHLKELSCHSWGEISRAGRHSLIGFEKLPIECFVPQKFPEIVSEDTQKLMVFRASGDNRVMVGVRQDNVFYVIFVETEFGDICRHGR